MFKEIVNFKINWIKYTGKEELNLDNCHIFKFNLKVYKDIESQYEMILSKNELHKASLFLLQKDSERYIIGKYFTRLLLANQLGIKPSEVTFIEIKNKKPAIANVNFNISHSGDLVLIALSNSAIGIDVEFVNANFNFEKLLTQCFKPSELLHIHSVSDFYVFWTRKEAIIKATGEGLVDDLQEIDCSQNRIFRQKKTYFLHSAYVDKNHIYSIAYTGDVKNLVFWN